MLQYLTWSRTAHARRPGDPVCAEWIAHRVARPFADQDRLVLAAGQAFQGATEWGDRRPVLETDDGPAFETYTLSAPALPRRGAILDEARMLVGLAGLAQDDEFVLALIAEAAPHARAMAGRLDRDYAFHDEI